MEGVSPSAESEATEAELRRVRAELAQTPEDTCTMQGKDGVLVFLHGVIEPGAGTQHAQQRAAAKAAAQHGLAAIMPKGVRGIAPPAIAAP